MSQSAPDKDADRVVALRPAPPALDVTAYEPRSVPEAQAVAALIARSGLLGKIPPRPETVFFLLARGRELGFSMAQSLDAFHILDGKPTLTAPAKVALCHRRSDVCRYLRCTESTADQATWETLREGHPEPTRHTYTLADAELAGLLKAGPQSSWSKRPKLMLRWRAATELINLVYPDLILGLYTPDEVEEVYEADRHIIDVEARVPTGVRPAPEPTPAAEPAAAPPPTPAPPAQQPRTQRTPLGRGCPRPECEGQLEVIQLANGARWVGCSNYRAADGGCKYREDAPRDVTPPPAAEPAPVPFDDPTEIPFT